MIGRTYALKGEPVVVLRRWRSASDDMPVAWSRRPGQPLIAWLSGGPTSAPRNVRIRHADGSLAIRPFRGLRKAPLSPADALDIAGAA